jgi:hypothetical protein
VRKTELSTLRRVGADKADILAARSNLANSYQFLGRREDAMPLRRDVYSEWLRLGGEEHRDTLVAALSYALSLCTLKRSDEAKPLLRKTIPVARRVLGESHEFTLKMRWVCVQTLYYDPDATLDDVREAVTTLEDLERTARRVLGGAHPTTGGLERDLRKARAALRACETAPGDVSAVCEAVAAMTPEMLK